MRINFWAELKVWEFSRLGEGITAMSAEEQRVGGGGGGGRDGERLGVEQRCTEREREREREREQHEIGTDEVR